MVGLCGSNRPRSARPHARGANWDEAAAHESAVMRFLCSALRESNSHCAVVVQRGCLGWHVMTMARCAVSRRSRTGAIDAEHVVVLAVGGRRARTEQLGQRTGGSPRVLRGQPDVVELDLTGTRSSNRSSSKHASWFGTCTRTLRPPEIASVSVRDHIHESTRIWQFTNNCIRA